MEKKSNQKESTSVKGKPAGRPSAPPAAAAAAAFARTLPVPSAKTKLAPSAAPNKAKDKASKASKGAKGESAPAAAAAQAPAAAPAAPAPAATVGPVNYPVGTSFQLAGEDAGQSKALAAATQEVNRSLGELRVQYLLQEQQLMASFQGVREQVNEFNKVLANKYQVDLRQNWHLDMTNAVLKRVG